MNVFKVDLSEVNSKSKGVLTCYIRDEMIECEKEWNRPAMIILAGGGYHQVVSREEEPVAMKFLAEGYNVFVLKYSLEVYPQHITDLGTAVMYVRNNAKELHVRADKVSAIGFSAAGHLVGNYTCEYKKVADILGVDSDGIKLNACCMSYPVVTAFEHSHANSFNNLSGGDTELAKHLALENLVNKDNCPTYIWHTREDEEVPTENSLLYAMSLQRNNIEYELHIFPKGVHGLSCCEGETVIANSDKTYVDKIACSWVHECISFINRVTGYNKYDINC